MKALALLLVLLAAALGGAGLPADLVAEQARLQAQLTARAAGFGFADVADLRKFDAAPDVALALSRQQLLRKVGAPALQAFRQEASPAAFLAWLWEDAAALNLFLEAATPLGLNQRDEDKWSVKTETLARWARLWQADPDSRRGVPLRLAMATALLPPGEGNHGAGQQVPPPDPLGRYQHFKQAYLAKELYPSFERHSVWEYMQVVSSPASDADLAWTRRMVNTWRPDLRAKEMVVKTVSEVKYGNSPHPYGDYKDVLDGGGKCGPRSSWGVMVCQAFGLPAVGVAQPGHACDYGAGWEKSRINGLSGPDFLQAVAARSRAAEFTRIERTRWLGAAVAPAAPAQSALKALLVAQMAEVRRAKVVFGEGDNAAEAEKEPPTKAAAPVVAKPAPVVVGAGAATLPAAGFSKLGGARSHESIDGGRQVYFEKNAPNTWAEFPVEVTRAGKYLIVLRTATPNTSQSIDLAVSGQKLATLAVPNSQGLWADTPAVEVELPAGPQVLRLTVPSQRGLALKQLELRAR